MGFIKLTWKLQQLKFLVYYYVDLSWVGMSRISLKIYLGGNLETKKIKQSKLELFGGLFLIIVTIYITFNILFDLFVVAVGIGLGCQLLLSYWLENKK